MEMTNTEAIGLLVEVGVLALAALLLIIRR